METHKTLRVDIVSDIVCPWCAVGYYQLAAAAKAEGLALDVHWHPFELNPHMGPEGQNITEHVAEKYGSTKAQSAAARERITEAGAEVGFTFAYTDASRIVNTFLAHQLEEWAEEAGSSHDLTLALMRAYFTDGRDISNPDVLAQIAGETGRDREAAAEALASGRFAAQVREKEQIWLNRGIHSVPAMIFDQQHLVPGAQGVETYRQVLQHLTKTAA